MKKILVFTITAISALLVTVAVYEKNTSAVTAADWKPGNIIDDAVFTNPNDMSVADIQNFLNAKVPSCDTNGTQPASEYGRPDLTHAQYAAQRGWPGPPYVCLKDYYEVPRYTPGDYIPANNFSGSIPAGSVSAAQIIYDAAKINNINPKAILIKIATESAGPLTSDTWPVQSQYTYAMGSHCPDSGPGGSANCDRNYAGFSMQVSSGVGLLRWYLDNMNQTWWSYKKPYQTNSILWNVKETGCGAGDVYIESMATAALYTYTPYQPNQAALNNMYSLGDGCSAYGNRNFWRVWNDWFGSPQDNTTHLSIKSHLSYYGWTSPIKNSGMTGTVGQSRPMEALKIDGDINYSTYSLNTGWQPSVANGMVSGTLGHSRTIQAVKLSPQGTLASKYDVWYRAHVSMIGWMGWVKNGSAAGVTGGANINIEAIDIRLTLKDSPPPGSTSNPYQNLATIQPAAGPSVLVESHVGMIGWQPGVGNEMISGIIDNSRRIEAIKVGLSGVSGISGNIMYSSHVSYQGWQGFVPAGQTSGTTGQFRQIEAFRATLTGDLGLQYDIWYRTLVDGIGWMGWAKNGDPAGSVGIGKPISAIEMDIRPKNTTLSLGAFYNPYNRPLPSNHDVSLATHVSYIGWTPSVGENQISGTTGQSKAVEAIRFNSANSIFGQLSIVCSAYSRGLGWVNDVQQGSDCGTTGKSSSLESIKLALAGEAAYKYDLYYKTHISFVGWSDWIKGGDTSGTDNSGKHIEAVIVKLVEK